MEPRNGLAVALLFTTVGLLCLLIGFFAWAVWRWRDQSAGHKLDEAATRERLEVILREVQGVDARLKSDRAELTESLAAGAEALRRDQASTSREVLTAIKAAQSDLNSLTTSTDRHATELERQVDDLTAFLAESASSAGDEAWPTLRVFVHPDADRPHPDDAAEDDATEDDGLDEVNVDVLLYSAADGDGRTNRLVLRRTAYVELDERTEASVEELWISDEFPSQGSVARAVRALYAVGALLVLGRPCPAVPGMTLATDAAIAAPVSACAAPDARVELLLLFRGRVRSLATEPWLAAAELSAAATAVGRVAREMVIGVIADLQLRPDNSGQPTNAEVPRLALTGDLDDARIRLEQQELWERIEGARLALARTPDGSADRIAEAVWSR